MENEWKSRTRESKGDEESLGGGGATCVCQHEAAQRGLAGGFAMPLATWQRPQSSLRLSLSLTPTPTLTLCFFFCSFLVFLFSCFLTCPDLPVSSQTRSPVAAQRQCRPGGRAQPMATRQGNKQPKTRDTPASPSPTCCKDFFGFSCAVCLFGCQLKHPHVRACKKKM